MVAAQPSILLIEWPGPNGCPRIPNTETRRFSANARPFVQHCCTKLGRVIDAPTGHGAKESRGSDVKVKRDAIQGLTRLAVDDDNCLTAVGQISSVPNCFEKRRKIL